MAGITLTIEVDDKGTVKVKQFADESRKAFDQMQAGPKAAQGPLDSLKESWIGLTAKIAIAAAAFYAAKRMIYDTAKQIASATNDIERQANVLGIGTDQLQKWQYAAKMSDVNAQEFAIGIKMLSRNMEDASTGAGDTARYFSAMGISVKDTSGHLRPLNDVMGDIMDKFASWEDGPRKIAIAMQLFGRSGETLIPLLNKGKTGFNEFAEEARKLGIILGPELIRKGSEAGDIFKKMEAQITATKLSLAPAALQFANFFADIVKDAKRAAETIGDIAGAIFSASKKAMEAQEEWRRKRGYPESNLGIQLGIKTPSGISTPGEEAERYRGKIPTIIGKTPPPAIGEKPKEAKEEDPLSAWNALIQKANEWGEVVMGRQELAELGWVKQEDIVSQVTAELARLERESNEWGEITVARQELVEAGWAAVAKAEENAIREGIENARLLHQAWLEEYTKVSEWETIWESVGQNISSAWASNMTNIIRGTGSMAEKVKSFFQSIGDVFLSTVSKMIAQWLIFGSITGKKEEGGSWLTGSLWSGLLGSILKFKEGGLISGFKPISAFQHGGLIDRPTLGLIGEGGPEAVVPLKSGKIPIEGGKGDTYLVQNYVQVTDPNSFVKIYGGIVKKLSEQSLDEAKRFNKMSTRT
jgi:hypothetical protein